MEEMSGKRRDVGGESARRKKYRRKGIKKIKRVRIKKWLMNRKKGKQQNRLAKENVESERRKRRRRRKSKFRKRKN